MTKGRRTKSTERQTDKQWKERQGKKEDKMSHTDKKEKDEENRNTNKKRETKREIEWVRDGEIFEFLHTSLDLHPSFPLRMKWQRDVNK